MAEAGTWEERMTSAARQREAQRHAHDDAYGRTLDDPHYGHHNHLSGCIVECSCGADRGVTCVAVDFDPDPARLSCDQCGKRGVVRVLTPAE